MKALNIQIAIKIYEYEELSAADRELIDAACQATHRSYAPYSHFSVGAAARLSDNTIVTGTNQENAAYPSGLCAERTTLFLCQLPVPRPSRRDSCHSRPQRVRRISGRAYSAMRGLPAGDARNGKTLQTSHACTAVRENRHL